MTKREMFAEIRTVVADNADMVAFIDNEIALLDRKSATPRKPTKTQIENDGYKAEIVQFLTLVDTPKTIKEIQENVPNLADLTNQRITHMLTDLIKAGKLGKDYVKKTPYFFIV